MVEYRAVIDALKGLGKNYLGALCELSHYFESFDMHDVYIRGSFAKAQEGMDIDLYVILEHNISQITDVVKETFVDGGRRYTIVLGRRFSDEHDRIISEISKRYGIPVKYSVQTEYGMEKIDGVPIEIHIDEGKEGKPAREVKNGVAIRLSSLCKFYHEKYTK